MHKAGVLSSAKHFPGHGLVSGDTHKSLQVINGPLKEIQNYPPLIKNGVLSIMVAHIAIENNEIFSKSEETQATEIIQETSIPLHKKILHLIINSIKLIIILY